MIRINVRSNAKQTIAELRVDQAKIKAAQVQALNRTAEQLRTQAGREIRGVYNIKLQAVRKASQIVKASRSGSAPRATVTFSGRSINLAEFDPRQFVVTTRRGKRRAVSVKVLVKGPRRTVSGGFMGRHGSGGYRGIFKRTGADQYPIKTLRSVSIPRALEQKAVAKALLQYADTRFEKNYDDALHNLMRR